jgi:hypothetical protein
MAAKKAPEKKAARKLTVKKESLSDLPAKNAAGVKGGMSKGERATLARR